MLSNALKKLTAVTHRWKKSVYNERVEKKRKGKERGKKKGKKKKEEPKRPTKKQTRTPIFLPAAQGFFTRPYYH